ncbi:MAG: Gfo/Idh/MocA family oxidoreductase [Actinobacteria bacterium]|nr:Gfo/Idh/MocA family oxidoreductase [Actinomycetota bacterium]
MSSASSPVRIGIIGLGYWGPNLARALASTPGCELAYACDLDEGNRARIEGRYPGTVLTDRFDDLLEDDTLDAIVVATGAPSHHAIGMRVLEAGKHALIEKPLALTVADARELVETADAKGRVLMVGHLLRFHPVFQQLQATTESGALGRMLYLYTNRLNFGKVRADENALWSLAPHDISLALALAGERPEEVSARGEAFLREGVEDVVFGYLHFPSGLVAHLHVSWLDPHKSRKLTVVGSEGMAVFDDTEADRKLTVYEKASSPSRFDTWGEFQALRTGDVKIPQVPNAEPLIQETKAFVDAIVAGKATVASGDEGLAVVEVLTALQTSLEQHGAPVRLDA